MCIGREALDWYQWEEDGAGVDMRSRYRELLLDSPRPSKEEENAAMSN